MTGAKLWNDIKFSNNADVYKYFDEYKDSNGYDCVKDKNVCVVGCYHDKIITNLGGIVPDFKQYMKGYDRSGNVIETAPGGVALREGDGFANREERMNIKRDIQKHTDTAIKDLKTEKREILHYTYKTSDMYIESVNIPSTKISLTMKKETRNQIKPGDMADDNWEYYSYPVGWGSERVKLYEVKTNCTGYYKILTYDEYDMAYVVKLAEALKLKDYKDCELHCWLRFYGYVEHYRTLFGEKQKVVITHMQKIYFARKTDPINKIGLAGCYLTCFADIISFYKGVLTRPRDVNDVVNINNLYLHNDSSEIQVDTVARKFVLNNCIFNDYKHDAKKDDEISKKISIHKQIVQRINENKATVLRINKTKFDTHFIVVIGARYDGKDEKKDPLYYIVNDPGSNDPKHRLIPVETMISPNKDRPITKINFID